MKENSDLNFELLVNDDLMDSLKPSSIKSPKIVFMLFGFLIGSVLSFVTLIIEHIVSQSLGITSLFNVHHLVAPILLGLVGGIFGGIYNKKIIQQKVIYSALYESQQTLKLITDNIPSMITYVDRNYRYRFVNKKHAEWLKVSVKESFGKTVKELLGDKIFNDILTHIEKAFEGQTISFESKRIIDRNKLVYLNSTLVPHINRNNFVTGIFVLVTDITDLRKRENKIRKQKTELQVANATKDKLFSIIAHDLKSPFNTIIGFTNYLEDEAENLSSDRINEICHKLNLKSNQAFHLTENILDWSRSQLNRISPKFEDINLEILINEITTQLNEIFDNKNIRFISKIKSGLLVYADRHMLSSILRNLLINSYKFSTENGEVLIDSSPEKEMILVKIEDQGKGMDKYQLSYLFSPEKQISTEGTNEEKGTGIGLLICKEFVNKMGGRIWADSELGVGSQFFFTIKSVEKTVAIGKNKPPPISIEF